MGLFVVPVRMAATATLTGRGTKNFAVKIRYTSEQGSLGSESFGRLRAGFSACPSYPRTVSRVPDHAAREVREASA